MKEVAEKCNACAHLVDAGYLPACAQVCPANAIIFGDINGPQIQEILNSKRWFVRRPETGARPILPHAGAKRPGPTVGVSPSVDRNAAAQVKAPSRHVVIWTR